MIPLDIGVRTALDNALVSSHAIDIKVFVTDLNGGSKADISDRLLGGQVDVDVTADVSRTLQVTLFDPNAEVALDSNDPTEAAVYMDNMLQVLYGVKDSGMTQYIYVPVFMGPVVSLSRNDDEIELTAFGKEHLAMGTFWKNFNAKKGSNKVDVIKRIMREGAGETKFLLPELPNARLSENLSIVALKQTPWQAAQKIARSMDRTLYYDGAGRLRMRKRNGNKVFTFEGGDSGTLMSVPSINFTTEEAKNAVVVKGKRNIKPKRKGEATKVLSFTARSVVERSHPLSPWKLGRVVDGQIVPRYLTEIIENDKINSAAQAEKVAENRLQDLIEQSVEISFDAQPIPYLEEYDRVSLNYDTFNGVFTLRQFSLPLSVGDVMSVGYNRRLLTVKRRRIKTTKSSKTRKVRKGRNNNKEK